jgi:bacteriophage CI repressor helix-turn-helix domain
MTANIKDIRKQYGLTQQALCDLLGIPKRTLEDWERLGCCPTYTAKLIAYYLQKEKGQSK